MEGGHFPQQMLPQSSSVRSARTRCSPWQRGQWAVQRAACHLVTPKSGKVR